MRSIFRIMKKQRRTIYWKMVLSNVEYVLDSRMFHVKIKAGAFGDKRKRAYLARWVQISLTKILNDKEIVNIEGSKGTPKHSPAKPNVS